MAENNEVKTKKNQATNNKKSTNAKGTTKKNTAQVAKKANEKKKVETTQGSKAQGSQNKNTPKKTNNKNNGNKKAPVAKKNTKKATEHKPLDQEKAMPKELDQEKSEVQKEKIETPKKGEVAEPPLVEVNFKELADMREEEETLAAHKLSDGERLLKRKDKLVDIGILVVIVGLFVLVLTTYLTGSLDLSYELTNTLVILSLVIEAIGICIIVANSFNRK